MSDPSNETSEPGGKHQTRSYLQGMLEANGLRPRRQLGQNFLIDLNLLELLVRASSLRPDDVVLEIGTGTGGLTSRVAERVAHVVSVEIDPGFHKLAQRETQHLSNITLLQCDALAGKNKLNPLVVDTLGEVLQRTGASRYELVANLPYDVSTAVIGNLLLNDLPIGAATVTVQQEFGERLVATPGSKDYGPLSILVQRVGDAQWVRTLPPTVFWPRPKVVSAIIRIHVHPEKRADLPFLRQFHAFLRDLFIHRRKVLRAALASMPSGRMPKREVDEILSKLNLEGSLRAEQLSPSQLEELFVEFQAGSKRNTED